MAAYFGRDLVKSEMQGKGQKQTALDPGGGIVRGGRAYPPLHQRIEIRIEPDSSHRTICVSLTG